jgi:hypothetical protein
VIHHPLHRAPAGAHHSLDHPRGWITYFWRKLVEHFVIDLADNSSYVDAGPPIYSDRTLLGCAVGYSYIGAQVPSHACRPSSFTPLGNFWLARYSYINKLPLIEVLKRNDRCYAET